MRYPQDLFDVQRSLLETVPRRRPGDGSTTSRDKWTVPADPFATSGDQPPYYVLANPPLGTSDTPEFQLTTPMTVNNSPNLAAYISVDSDAGPNYGKMTVLRVPNKSAIQGPQQIANVFKTQSQISEDITLLDTGQSRIIHGNLLTLPLGNSFLYVEPLYVQSTYPTLQRILVTFGDKIGYGATLDAALSDLKPGHTPGQTLKQLGSTTGNDPNAGGTTAPTTSPTVAVVLADHLGADDDPAACGRSEGRDRPTEHGVRAVAAGQQEWRLQRAGASAGQGADSCCSNTWRSTARCPSSTVPRSRGGFAGGYARPGKLDGPARGGAAR